MSGKARFRYALAPVLLTRTWKLDALMIELGEQSAAVAAQMQVQSDVSSRIDNATAAWKQKTANGQFQSVDQFVLATRYMGELSRLARESALRMEELTEQRDELIVRVVAARREVDASEEHRDAMRALFVQQRLSGDFKVADDNWNTLQSGATAHGN